MNLCPNNHAHGKQGTDEYSALYWTKEVTENLWVAMCTVPHPRQTWPQCWIHTETAAAAAEWGHHWLSLPHQKLAAINYLQQATCVTLGVMLNFSAAHDFCCKMQNVALCCSSMWSHLQCLDGQRVWLEMNTHCAVVQRGLWHQNLQLRLNTVPMAHACDTERGPGEHARVIELMLQGWAVNNPGFTWSSHCWEGLMPSTPLVFCVQSPAVLGALFTHSAVNVACSLHCNITAMVLLLAMVNGDKACPVVQLVSF